MTRDEAEEVWMAWTLGYENDRGRIATAILLLDEEGDFFEGDTSKEKD